MNYHYIEVWLAVGFIATLFTLALSDDFDISLKRVFITLAIGSLLGPIMIFFMLWMATKDG